MVPLVRFELTYYTPLFERGDFTKFVHRGKNTGYRIQCSPLESAALELSRPTLACLQASAVEA